MIPWLREHYDAEIVTYTGDLGQPGSDLEAIRRKALDTGASEAIVEDLRERFLMEFCFPAMQAGAMYEGRYPMHTSLGRPLLAQRLVEVAESVGADAIAHGCTGKGNDQVRFELAAQALAPQLGIVAPLREWDLTTRELEIEYAEKHDIPVPVTKDKPYSIDENLWGCAIECGVMEDVWREPPSDAWRLTTDPLLAPREVTEVVIAFHRGVPVALDGRHLTPVDLVTELNGLAGRYGIGRIDMIENRVVGLKSREVYENPAAVLLYMAHREIERLCLDRATLHYKMKVGQDFATLVYDGLWFSPLREALQAFVSQTEIHLTGEVRLALTAGNFQVVGRRSPFSLYDEGLATYSDGDTFDRSAAVGFLKLYGLPYKTWGKVRRAHGVS
ncbi:MAG: argininosuccinate synthase [Myxococcales bacterium]|nr:argininosuccinate synthase [Myxococcales bacterium]